jgi:esterase/lipase
MQLEFAEKLFEFASSSEEIKALKEYLKYFDDFVKMASEQEEQLTREIQQLKSIEQTDHFLLWVEKLYQDIEKSSLEIINYPEEMGE